MDLDHRHQAGNACALPTELYCNFIKEPLGLQPKAVIGDSEYDSATIIEYIVKELCAKLRIAKNIRGGTSPSLKLSPSGAPVCIAGFEMLSRGTLWG